MGVIVHNNEYITRTRELSVYRDDGSHKVMRVTNTMDSYEEIPLPMCDVDVDIDFDIYKSREDEMLVSGWANVALDKNGEAPLDWQDDTISPVTLEKAAIQFMLDYRDSGEMHKGGSVGTIVESIVLTKEKQQAIGIPEGTVPEGWFITVKVHNKDVFAKVKDGTYKMFSIQGKAKRVER